MIKKLKHWLKETILPEYGVSSRYYQLTLSIYDGVEFPKYTVIRHFTGYSYIIENEDDGKFVNIHCLHLNKLGSWIVKL